MSESVIPGAFSVGDVRANESGKAAEPVRPSQSREAPPIGYRWVSKRWRVLPDGTRDYAAYHGTTEFTFLLPVSSRLRSPKR